MQMSLVTSGLSRSTYDVFLSFRGKDTRRTFTDHLYAAFTTAGFRTFRDDDELEDGEGINPGLRNAIHQSRSSVIVFSKDYASSRWCLDELVMILDRRRTSDHVVLPVFYGVEPSQARKQTGSFEDAFAIHEDNQFSKNKVKGWRAAMAEVADLKGLVLQNQDDRHESKFIEKIVKVIEDKICRTPLSVGSVHVIGIQSQVDDISLWIRDGSADFGVLLIYGMRGIGKTTMAKLVYNLNYKAFQGSSFLENVKERAEQPNGLVQIQMQLLSDVFIGRKKKIHIASDGMIKIQDAVRSKRVLLVLDDVDHIDQLNPILGMRDEFYPGSKVIVTTSHVGLLKAQHQVLKVHKVETFGYNDSLELFSWHAFGQDRPVKGYMEHAKRVVDQCAGLPLALKVLGLSLSQQSIVVWKSALDKLEAIPHAEIMKKLKISYDSLQVFMFAGPEFLVRNATSF